MRLLAQAFFFGSAATVVIAFSLILSNAYLRYHLALRVPENNPPTMRVKDTIHRWEEGKSIVFDDSLEHEVYNKSDQTRVVLIVDFLRPMNLPAHALNVVLLKLAPYSEEAREAISQIERES
jgi:hypothetical protein